MLKFVPKIIFLISRVQSHHLLLAVIDHNEEEQSVFFDTGYKRYSIEFLAQSVESLSLIGIVLVDAQAEVDLRGFASAFDRLAQSKYIR